MIRYAFDRRGNSVFTYYLVSADILEESRIPFSANKIILHIDSREIYEARMLESMVIVTSSKYHVR